MEYDVVARNADAKITIPAQLLHDLISVSQGYTMSGGNFINKTGVIREASNRIYYDSDFEIWGPSLLTGRWENEQHSIVVREDLSNE